MSDNSIVVIPDSTPAPIATGRKVGTKGWTPKEGIDMLIKAEALVVTEDTVAGDPKWDSILSHVWPADGSNGERSKKSMQTHFKDMMRCVRTVSSSFSLTPAAKSGPKCPNFPFKASSGEVIEIEELFKNAEFDEQFGWYTNVLFEFMRGIADAKFKSDFPEAWWDVNAFHQYRLYVWKIDKKLVGGAAAVKSIPKLQQETDAKLKNLELKRKVILFYFTFRCTALYFTFL